MHDSYATAGSKGQRGKERSPAAPVAGGQLADRPKTADRFSLYGRRSKAEGSVGFVRWMGMGFLKSLIQ